MRLPVPSLRYSLDSYRGVVLPVACGLVLAAARVHAATPDFSGAWRLDDQHSDTAATLATLLRAEARREQPAALPPAAQAGTPSGDSGSGQHAGGMGRHRMGGGGMNGSGMGGGGRGRHRGSDAAGKTSDTAQADQTRFALPPLLQRDSVLLVQEQAQSVEVQLDNGERLDVRLDGHARQSLDGDAMVEGQAGPNALHVTIRYAEGGVLQQDWVRSADGRHLTVDCMWKPPALQKPVSFKRSYLAVG